MRNNICPAETWPELASIGLDGLGGYNLVQGHFGYNLLRLLPRGTKVITFLREPLQRTVSAIRHIQREPKFHPIMHDRVKSLSVSEALRDELLMSELANNQTAAIAASSPVEEIIEKIQQAPIQGHNHDAGKFEEEPSFAIAKERLEKLDFVGICEYFNESILLLSRLMSFHPPKIAAKINVAPGGGTNISSLSSADLDILRHYNKLDIALYQHALKLFNLRRSSLTVQEALRHFASLRPYEETPMSFQLNLGMPMPGSNWYEQEIGDDGCPFRWSGPSSISTLELPLQQGSSYSVRMKVWFLHHPSNAQYFRVSVEEEFVPAEIWTDDGEGYDVRFTVADTKVKNDVLTQIEFHVPTWAEPNCIDTRPLGFLLGSCIVEALKN